MTRIKTLFVKHYPDKIPYDWITNDIAVSEYLNTGKLPIPGFKTLMICLVIIISILILYFLFRTKIGLL